MIKSKLLNMKISEIYEEYKIMPQLQLHMLRVAGVALVIANSYIKSLDKNSIISACLLHDIGNIIKFDLTLFPETLKPKGLKYWQGIQKQFVEKYGNDDHEATYRICKELSINPKALDIVGAFGFNNAQKLHKTTHIELKIAVYSDMRIAPHGITSLDNRLSEAKKRYAEKIEKKYPDFDKKAILWKKIEKQIFAHCKIGPEDITEEKVQPLLKKLRNYNIETM